MSFEENLDGIYRALRAAQMDRAYGVPTAVVLMSPDVYDGLRRGTYLVAGVAYDSALNKIFGLPIAIDADAPEGFWHLIVDPLPAPGEGL